MSIGVLRRTATVSFTVIGLLALPLLGGSASAAPSADGATSAGGAHAAPASDHRSAKVVPVARDLAIERYVALGDSYTAGPLIPWPRFDPVGCLKSTRNYPEYLSRELGLDDYTDESCSGAQTSHMTSEQSVPLGTNQPQFDALSADTDLVSVGIGGNDFGTFGNLVDSCPGFRDADPTGSPCREHYT
ncbi:MAG: GDSL-type esterase/lipase family protein, partial [Micromonosporaceae bacterium]